MFASPASGMHTTPMHIDHIEMYRSEYTSTLITHLWVGLFHHFVGTICTALAARTASRCTPALHAFLATRRKHDHKTSK